MTLLDDIYALEQNAKSLLLAASIYGRANGNCVSRRLESWNRSKEQKTGFSFRTELFNGEYRSAGARRQFDGRGALCRFLHLLKNLSVCDCSERSKNDFITFNFTPFLFRIHLQLHSTRDNVQFQIVLFYD